MGEPQQLPAGVIAAPRAGDCARCGAAYPDGTHVRRYGDGYRPTACGCHPVQQRSQTAPTTPAAPSPELLDLAARRDLAIVLGYTAAHPPLWGELLAVVRDLVDRAPAGAVATAVDAASYDADMGGTPSVPDSPAGGADTAATPSSTPPSATTATGPASPPPSPTPDAAAALPPSSRSSDPADRPGRRLPTDTWPGKP